jgi:hypothetical protein
MVYEDVEVQRTDSLWQMMTRKAEYHFLAEQGSDERHLRRHRVAQEMQRVAFGLGYPEAAEEGDGGRDGIRLRGVPSGFAKIKSRSAR